MSNDSPTSLTPTFPFKELRRSFPSWLQCVCNKSHFTRSCICDVERDFAIMYSGYPWTSDGLSENSAKVLSGSA